ncbi:amidohydrolase family protein [Rubellicoccus peritrichatus]|uniref:Amidohydrolase family protein n=1 Tax=Rubellicoccus peritrichatus TaxID=3080537 RepID=A0AAQ3QUT6_9BACT|nr:amidohydrolase family protein [Puniceicoccus sp. CR14]WOO40260.1 amidohydrolase family protein [Puniceicoccus sp. CR14]
MKIDSHHHFWRYNPSEFGWIEDDIIRHDFLPDTFEQTLKQAGINGAVSVQARESLEETFWLLELATQHAYVMGVVGWVPMAEAGALSHLDQMRGREWLKGIRLATQGRDPSLLEDEMVNWNVASLHANGLTCDLLLTGDQLAPYIPFVKRHPEQKFVLDHCAKPTITSAGFDHEWARHMETLAGMEHVQCKVSGMVTEIRDEQWDAEVLKPYWEHVLNCFGPQRLLFGSDWPVCLSRAEYVKWCGIVEGWLSQLSPDEQTAIWSGNSKSFYQL